MRQGISLLAIGHATSLFLAVTFALCVAFDLLFPQHAMFEVWRRLLPGFEWLSWGSFVLAQVCHLKDKCQSDQSVKFQYGTTFVVPDKKLTHCNEETLCSIVTNLG
jgi:hypothetical protein